MQTELFEKEIGPGVLQSSVRKACVLQECQRHKGKATNYISILSFLSGILAAECLLNAKLEHSRSNLVFDIRYNFTFGMLYQVLILKKISIHVLTWTGSFCEVLT